DRDHKAVAMTIRDENGDPVQVILGPQWFMKNQPIRFNSGSQATVKGAVIEQDGRRMLIASQVTVGNRILTLRTDEGEPAWTSAPQSASARR
ncbi:MAG: hypothetical protein VYC34_02300, partial [Planctomycetota bacterium]|nr:hypothetical protein [Planctomycetota bacterium]